MYVYNLVTLVTMQKLSKPSRKEIYPMIAQAMAQVTHPMAPVDVMFVGEHNPIQLW